MMKFYTSLSITLILIFGGGDLFSQNVGIGTPTPDQRLDVEGWVELGDETQGGAGPATAGAIRYNTGGFPEYYDGGAWRRFGTGVEVGTIDPTGTVLAGTATAAQTGPGAYDVTFGTPFTGTPVVSLTPWQTGGGPTCGVGPCGTAPAQATYCVAVGDCSFGDQIDNFSTTGAITNIADLGTGCSPGDYRSSTQTLTIDAGGSFNFTMAVNSPWDQGLAIYIDFNQDGDYDDAGEEVFLNGTAAQSFSGTINIPCTAICGTTRMRVRSNFLGAPGGPCTFETYGETHDYNIVINQLSGGTTNHNCEVTAATTAGFSVQCYDAAGTQADTQFNFRASE